MRRAVLIAALGLVLTIAVTAGVAAAGRAIDPAEGPGTTPAPPTASEADMKAAQSISIGESMSDLTTRAAEALHNPAYANKWIGMVRTPDGSLDLDVIVDKPSAAAGRP